MRPCGADAVNESAPPQQLTGELSPARLGDQLAVMSLRLDRPVDGRPGLTASGGTAEFDNVSVARLYQPASSTTCASTADVVDFGRPGGTNSGPFGQRDSPGA
ncbi:hypothetical protein [Micromonospora sp. NPDC049102]|uniref:hypothetical protein n=1 Tax=Micromonospora sp. NPDC049102 TaxID=3364265 RepID=UPI00371C8786